MSNLWQPGRRLFTVAAVLMILTAGLHTWAQLGPPVDKAEALVFATMRGYHLDMGWDMHPSLFDAFRTLAFVMTIMFVGIALMNLVFAATADTSAVLLRRITWVNIIWVAAFSALCLGYQLLPPSICGMIILVVLVASLTANKPR